MDYYENLTSLKQKKIKNSEMERTEQPTRNPTFWSDKDTRYDVQTGEFTR